MQAADAPVTDPAAVDPTPVDPAAAPPAAEPGVMETLEGYVTNPETLLPLLADVGIIVLKVIVIFIVARLIAGWAKGLVTKALTKAKIDVTLAKFFGNLAKWAVMVLGVLAILEAFAVDTTGAAAIIAGASLAIGLAFQGSLGNMAAGVMLLVFRPFKVGDYVIVAGTAGTVDEVELFTTTLNTPDNRRIMVPNGSIFGNTIENVSFHPKRRVDVSVGTEYAADLDKTREVLMNAARSVPKRDESQDPIVYLSELGGSSINWAVRIWAPSPDFWAVKEEATRRIKMALDEAGIGIPFPQMDVHIDGAVARVD